jgi:hypothetical protein
MQKVRVVLVAHMMLVAQEKFPRTENFPKISLLKVENFQLQNFSDVKFVSANHILQNFLSAENLCRPITFYKIFFRRKICVGQSHFTKFCFWGKFS